MLAAVAVSALPSDIQPVNTYTENAPESRDLDFVKFTQTNELNKLKFENRKQEITFGGKTADGFNALDQDRRRQPNQRRPNRRCPNRRRPGQACDEEYGVEEEFPMEEEACEEDNFELKAPVEGEFEEQEFNGEFEGANVDDETRRRRRPNRRRPNRIRPNRRRPYRPARPWDDTYEQEFYEGKFEEFVEESPELLIPPVQAIHTSEMLYPTAPKPFPFNAPQLLITGQEPTFEPDFEKYDPCVEKRDEFYDGEGYYTETYAQYGEDDFKRRRRPNLRRPDCTRPNRRDPNRRPRPREELTTLAPFTPTVTQTTPVMDLPKVDFPTVQQPLTQQYMQIPPKAFELPTAAIVEAVPKPVELPAPLKIVEPQQFVPQQANFYQYENNYKFVEYPNTGNFVVDQQSFFVPPQTTFTEIKKPDC